MPFSSDSDLQINKARVIDAEGKIINLNESKILTAQDEEIEVFEAKKQVAICDLTEDDEEGSWSVAIV